MMKHATHSSLRPSTIWVMLLLVIFSVQACGPQMNLNPVGGGAGYDGQLNANTIKDIDLEICLGQDSDADGLCDDEEEPDCIDDPHCYDDDDIVLDSMREYNTGAWGRFLVGIGIAAAGTAAVVGVIGASGKAPRKGKAKWGWLHNLIQDNPDADAKGFIRLLDKNGYTLDDTLLKIQYKDAESFYLNEDANDAPWMMRINQIELTNETYGVFINGKLLEAGKDLHICYAGSTAVSHVSDNFTLTVDDQLTHFHRAKLSVRMKKEYTKVHKQTMTLTAFNNLCRHSPNGGVYIALALKDGSDYFVNALPLSMVNSQGVAPAGSLGIYDTGFTLDYLFQNESGVAPHLPEVLTNQDTKIKYRRYNEDSFFATGEYELALNDTKDPTYNDCDSTECRVKYILGHATTSKKQIAQADEEEMAMEETSINQCLANPAVATSEADEEAFCYNLGTPVKGIEIDSGAYIW